MITEDVKQYSECCGCVNSCNKFVSTRSYHEIPYDTLMKS